MGWACWVLEVQFPGSHKQGSVGRSWLKKFRGGIAGLWGGDELLGRLGRRLCAW